MNILLVQNVSYYKYNIYQRIITFIVFIFVFFWLRKVSIENYFWKVSSLEIIQGYRDEQVIFISSRVQPNVYTKASNKCISHCHIFSFFISCLLLLLKRRWAPVLSLFPPRFSYLYLLCDQITYSDTGNRLEPNPRPLHQSI